MATRSGLLAEDAPSKNSSNEPLRLSLFDASLHQQRLWFLEQLEPHNVSYNVPMFLRLKIALDIPTLQQSLDALIQRHEALRTTFVAVEGLPMQVIAPTLTMPLQIGDIQHIAEGERDAELLRLVTENVRRPFDLTQGPLLRGLLVKLKTEEYVLALTAHHIIFDGWSINVLLQDLASLYTAFSTSQAASLPDLPMQYRDFASQQQEYLQGEAFANQLAYWKRQLADAPASLELPTDRPRAAMQTFAGATHRIQLSQQLSTALRMLSYKERGSLYMTLITAFSTLLHRYTGQSDIAIGTVSAGRTQESQAVIGFFTNTLVLRTNLADNPSFHEAFRQVREVVFDALDAQDVPFELIVKEVQPNRALNANPFFQVMLAFQPSLPALIPGWEPIAMNIETGASKFDLTLNVEDFSESILCSFEYRTDLFDASTIARMANHFQTLLEAIVDNTDSSLAALPLLTEPERHQLLVEWNETAVAYPTNLCLHFMIEDQVERTPDSVAVIFEREHLTYRELDRKANSLAHFLQQRGVGPDVLVGVCMERSLEMVISLLAILKAGGAYVPLDPTYPPDRLAYMLQDAQMPLLLTQERFKAALTGTQIVCVDTEWSTIAQQPTDRPVSDVQPHNLAYMIYTSGSTGKPKGALNTHKGICNRLLWMQDAYSLQIGEGVMQKTPFSFDVSVWEFFWPLMVEARLVVARPEGHRDTAYLAQLIEEQHITTMHFVPSMLRLFLEERNVERCQSLKRVICSGEALPFEVQQHFFERLPATELHNLYGPTEAAVDVTYWQCERNGTRRIVPIGRPIANTDLYILDAFLNPVPIGVPGELYIGGTGLGRGYFHRPELTAERFIPHPFSNRADARLYKTGDLVRYLSDGNIEYLGRLDHQVKINGVRIELGEIEAALDSHPAVREVVVVAQESAGGNKTLVAYVSLHQEQTASVGELRDYIKAQLPVHMVPSAFMLLPALPLLPNGKINRNALPELGASEIMKESSFVAPTSMVQQQLILLWEELLEARPIGIQDNFFHLGGHSLLAARLLSRIQQVFGKKLALPTLFAEPTIEQLARVLQQQDEGNARSSLVAIQTSGTKQPLFYLHGAYRGDGFYCFPLAKELGADQPFYALDPYQFDSSQVPPSVEDIAAMHVTQIRAVQPEGPYLLGGFCNGGVFAYEIARQLTDQGQSVDLLISVEPSAIGYHERIRQGIEVVSKLLGLSPVNEFLRLRYAYNYLRHIYRYMCLPQYRRLEKELASEQENHDESFILRWNALYELEQVRGTDNDQSDTRNNAIEHRGRDRFIASLFGCRDANKDAINRSLPHFKALFPDPIFPDSRLLHQDWEGLFFYVLSKYKAGSYAGKTSFFFSEASEETSYQEWLKVAKEKSKDVEVHFIEGNHQTWKTEYLHDFAAQLHMSMNNI